MTTYQDAGVDLDMKDAIGDWLRQRAGTGLFGGFLPVSQLKAYQEPVLVSSIDGVGTKVRLAAVCDRLDGLGFDIVNHCANDIAVHGAKPLLFLDYLAFNTLDTGMVTRIVESIQHACASIGVHLAGGETAEMPMVYADNAFDVAGAIIGAVEQGEIINGSTIREGDVVLGFESSGVHTNGFSLIQAIFTDAHYRTKPFGDQTLGELLLTPHRSYLDQIDSLTSTGMVHGLAHITGGGIPGNLSRIIPAGLRTEINLPPMPPLFQLIASQGVERDEMRRVFNLGIGLIAVCDPSIATNLPAGGIKLGEIMQGTNGERSVVFVDS